LTNLVKQLIVQGWKWRQMTLHDIEIMRRAPFGMWAFASAFGEASAWMSGQQQCYKSATLTADDFHSKVREIRSWVRP